MILITKERGCPQHRRFEHHWSRSEGYFRSKFKMKDRPNDVLCLAVMTLMFDPTLATLLTNNEYYANNQNRLMSENSNQLQVIYHIYMHAVYFEYSSWP